MHRGAHEAVEQFLRFQRDAGGPIGAGGPAWPRLIPTVGDRASAGVMPNAMVRMYPNTRFDMPGWPWPELTPVLMDAGDAVVALHSLPHTPTPNLSTDPRINIYFRLRRYRPQNPHEGSRRVAWGVSDHPDRGFFGQFLEYPEGYDPFKVSIEFLCDHWSDWDGMRDIVANERSRRPVKSLL